MKNIKIIALLTMAFVLAGCFGGGGGTTEEKDVNEIKQDLLNTNTQNNQNSNVPVYVDEGLSNTGNTNTNSNNTQDNSSLNSNSSNNPKNFSVRYYGASNFIEVDDLNGKNFSNMKIEITGKTLVNVDKILVSFSNPTSPFPDSSNFQLKKFNAGDKTFLYNAFKEYESLDYGTNIYLIEAYSGDEVGRAEVTIIIPRPGEENVSSNSSVSNNVVTNPENINSLTIKQIEPDLEITTSDAVNAFLYENLGANAWFYWNSLRPIKNNVGASFYAIVLNGDTYSYSRYYYAPNGTYGVLLLETGTDINKENIGDKNVEFRERNASFDTSEADTYFINLLNS